MCVIISTIPSSPEGGKEGGKEGERRELAAVRRTHFSGGSLPLGREEKKEEEGGREGRREEIRRGKHDKHHVYE